MEHATTRMFADPDYVSHGYVANPFSIREKHLSRPGVGAVIHAAACSLISAVFDMADSESGGSLWVVKSPEIPIGYYVSALSETIGGMVGNRDLDVLPAYIPFEMLKLGRTRSALSVVAERIAEDDFPITLGLNVLRLLEDVDTRLPEYGPLCACDLDEIRRHLESDPAGAIEEHFGKCVMERESRDEGDRRMHVAITEQSRLAVDPDESGDTAEEADEAVDPGVEDGEPVGDDTTVGESEEEPETGESPDAVSDYVIAHLKKHVSPVLARAVRAYRESGTAAFAEQMRITKAPRKTLVALTKFASLRYRKVLLVYDRLEGWPRIPEDLRAKIVGTFADLRYSLGGTTLLAFIVTGDDAPELAHLFSDGKKVSWAMEDLLTMTGDDVEVTVSTVQRWLDFAALDDVSGLQANGPELASALSTADGDASLFIPAAARVFDEWASCATGSDAGGISA